MVYITSYFVAGVHHTPTARTIAAAFGLGAGGDPRYVLCENLKLDLAAGRILFLTGPSGSGKSSLLRVLKRQFAPVLDLDDVAFKDDTIVADQFDGPLPEALGLLARAGLADAYLFLRTPAELSDGQRFRLRLALALARRPRTIVIDRFLDDLDRLTAKILAHQVRKFADQTGAAFLLASPNHDFVDQLRPDLYIEKPFAEPPLVKTTATLYAQDQFRGRA